MGTIDFQQPIVSTTKTNMKLFIIAAVLIASVVAEPDSKSEAEPWLAYANYGYAGYPYAARTYAAAAYPYSGVYGLGYNGYATGLGYGHYLGKRSADSDSEAEAEAKPWLAYSSYGYPYAGAYAARYAGAYAHTYAPATYAAYGAYARPAYAYAGAHYLGKRSADAEPESWYGNYGYGYAPYTAGYRYAAYSPYTYGAYAGYGYNGYAYGK